jgi:hypothetical protein
MDVVQLIKGRLGSDILSFDWSLAFILANLSLFAFFIRTTTLSLITFPIIAFVAFLILGEMPRWKSCLSLIATAAVGMYNLWAGLALAVLLLLVYFLFMNSHYKKTKESLGIGISSVGEGLTILRYNTVKVIVATLRSLFFNVSYMLFPLLFVWLVIFGSTYWLSYATLSISLTDFAAILTVLGVVFGLLQYYFTRHEEKVQQKLVSYFTSVVFPIGEFSFAKFHKFLAQHEGKYGDVKREADTLTDTSISELSKYFRETGKEKSIITMNLPDFGDMQKFQMLEAKSKLKKNLKEAYKSFFEAKRAELKKELYEKRASLNELVWFLFSNINIVEEANLSFLTLNLGKKEGDSESYTDFLLLTEIDMLKYIFDVVLGSYKPPVEDGKKKEETGS